MKKLLWIIPIGVLLLIVFLIGCTGTEKAVDSASAEYVQIERCATCHEDVGENVHQAVYDMYSDQTDLQLTIESVKSDGTMTVTIMKDGAPLIDKDGLPSLNQKRFYTVTYDSATGKFDKSVSYSNPVSLGDGRYTVTASPDYDINNSNGLAYGYIADGPLDVESGGHISMYDNVASGSIAFGDVSKYDSVANVEGCEACHGSPYGKHGYRYAEVAGIPDFAACKTCHYDTRNGGHIDWQILVDNPERYAEIHEGAETTDEEGTQYAYTANIMNDVHMSHAMEFPYPQSMSNCATCHEGKLDRVLSVDNFKLETCVSCHPVNGPEEGTDPHRAPALTTVIPHALDYGECSSCHSGSGMAPAFNKIHTGYNEIIYADTTGTKYSDNIKVSIDGASLSGNKLTVDISASGSAGGLSSADLVPELMIGLYGYDTKDFIVNGHDRYDSSGNGEISRADGDLPKGAYEVGTEHAYFKTDSEAPGDWTVTTDLSEWSDMIKDGTIRRVEIAVLPMLDNADGEEVALNAVSRTFDLSTKAFDDGFYSDIVDVENGCNNCHDALATTFHTPDRGGNIVVCRMCHVGLAGGSHLEVQSRSIDSYVHAIHSFQAFDIGDIDFADPVAAMEYDLHVEHNYPNFTIKNCESCHNPGMYNVPDQARSLPGILSASDEVTTMDRAIEGIPSYVTGPAARACGGCHRARAINEDNAEELNEFLNHTNGGGYVVENGEGVLDKIIKSVMSIFNKR